jgi:NAD(P)-dependent dehydrogenase (short-subunit alcohol dehydrogenase family)
MERRTLKDKIALITGAGRGIGRAIALRLAEEGAHIVVNEINEDAALRVVEEIKQMGPKAISVVADISNRFQVDEMMCKIKAHFEDIHVLVNNAGIEHRAPIMTHSEKEWDRVLNVNLKGPFLCCQKVVPLMIKQKWGRIINISSMAYRGMGGQVAYDASKGGLLALTKSLAIDLARYYITVNAVCPGWVETEMIQGNSELQDLKDKIIKRIPMRRLAKPEEIAGAVCFLATEEASYISGQNINVEGAWLR